MSSSRVGLRFFQNSRTAFQNLASPFRRPGLKARRFQSTEAGASTAPAQSFLQRSWNSPVGVKTVHFWAPVMKWVLVLAGLSDLTRPADKLSLTQNGALMATGAIWTRWCLIIKPKNVLLAAVNFFVGCVGATQVTRIFLHKRAVDGSSKEALKELSHEATDPAKAAVHRAEHKAEELVKRH
ncbi:hypothetical protein AJ79_08877 [Helicocarpus griseus UAMH5409]|uniref:Mitochondrial pyruvate carrier n=1 Tax=Helicocarpus griseus UAMH5409 TaxID=1447875 RepID=A0A2B7WPB4_9EURO|nr:hypothetical protein AJ79_08877 [Helicocarpus griseus UAMH5409]